MAYIKNKLVLPDDFDRYFFYFFTGHWRNLWLTLTEPFGSAGPLMNTTVPGADWLFVPALAKHADRPRQQWRN